MGISCHEICFSRMLQERETEERRRSRTAYLSGSHASSYMHSEWLQSYCGSCTIGGKMVGKLVFPSANMYGQVRTLILLFCLLFLSFSFHQLFQYIDCMYDRSPPQKISYGRVGAEKLNNTITSHSSSTLFCLNCFNMCSHTCG